MKQYGYLKKDDESSASLYTEEGLSEILKTVQKFGAIKETGQLDEETLKLMASPRCGNPDIVQGKRSKRFAIISGWNKRNITYFIANWSPRLGEEKVTRLIEKALNTWGAYANLKFSKKNSPDADIIVSFARGYHNDQFPFDGPGKVLAHAFFPYEGSEISGDIHFDDDEDWEEKKTEESEGTDFFSVALHELGHSLGLAHSNDFRSVMFPYYKGGDEGTLQLGHDDILGMYQLYIARPIEEVTTTTLATTRTNRPTRTRPTTPDTEGSHGHTRQGTRTTVAPSTEYSTYSERNTWQTRTHKGEFSTRYTEENSWSTTTPYPYTKEYPYTERSTLRYPASTQDVNTGTKEREGSRTTINRYWYRTPPSILPSTTQAPPPNICEGNVDAVANLRGELFVFKDQYIWRYQEKNWLMPGYPVTLHQMFPELPDNVRKIDAAYQRPDSNMILFAGDQYWVYDGSRFIESSPRSILDYGVPAGIDGVQNWGKNERTYLYKGDRFWKYDETNKKVDPGYPQPIQRWKGVPNDIDDAMTWTDGQTYFFKGKEYWKFDNNLVSVSRHYPRSFSRDWLRCQR